MVLIYFSEDQMVTNHIYRQIYENFIGFSLTKSNCFISLYNISIINNFGLAFSIRFRLIIGTKNSLRGSNKNPANYFKGHEVATRCHPIPTILQTEKSLQRGTDRLIWNEWHPILLFSLPLTPWTNGLSWTINSYFRGFLCCWLCQFDKSIAFMVGFEGIPELQEICLTNKLDFLSCCWKAELKADTATAYGV